MIENEILNNMLSRASVRKFTSENVSDEAVQSLLRAAMAAPSAMNFMPWHFIVIRSEETKEKLKAILPFAKMIGPGCVGIVVCGNTSMYERVSQMDKEDNTLYWVQDCSAASQNLLLAAHAIGLGAVWTGIFPLESRIGKLRSLLHIPAHITPLNLLIVGHPVQPQKAKDKWDADKIHYEAFQ